MSLLSNLQNSVLTSSIGGTSQFALSTGCANNDIQTYSQNAMIKTCCGNQNIAVDVSNNLAIETGCCGSDNIIGYAKNAFIATNSDDDTVILDCDNLDLDIGCGNDNVIVSAKGAIAINGGCGDKAILAESLNQGQENNYITLTDGNHTINTRGNNFGIATGNGNQTIGTYGNNYRVVTGNGNNKIGFYGNNHAYSLGSGNHDIRTLDNWFTSNEFTNIYDSSTIGVFDHNIGLAQSFTVGTAALDSNNNLCYAIRGASDISIETGNGTLQGLVTVGNGNFSVKTGDSETKRNIDISLGQNGALQTFKSGSFRAQNGCILQDK